MLAGELFVAPDEVILLPLEVVAEFLLDLEVFEPGQDLGDEAVQGLALGRGQAASRRGRAGLSGQGGGQGDNHPSILGQAPVAAHPAIPLLAYFHGKDRKLNDRMGRLVGDGDIDWPLFLSLYHRHTEGTPFILEYVNATNVCEIRDRVLQADSMSGKEETS